MEHLSTNKGKQLSDIEEKSRNTVLFASTVCVIDWSATTPLFLFHCTRSASVGFPESTTALYSPEDPRNERAAPIDGPRRERDRPLHEDPPRFGVGRNENEAKCSGGQATERARPSGWGKSKPRVLEGASVLLERGRERTKEREREEREGDGMEIQPRGGKRLKIGGKKEKKKGKKERKEKKRRNRDKRTKSMHTRGEGKVSGRDGEGEGGGGRERGGHNRADRVIIRDEKHLTSAPGW